MSKIRSTFRVRLILSNHQLKIDCHKHSLLYMNLMVTTNQKPIIDIPKKGKERKLLKKVINVQKKRAREKERNRKEPQNN